MYQWSKCNLNFMYNLTIILLLDSMYSYGGSGKSQLKDRCIRKTFLAVRGCFAQKSLNL